MHVFSSARRHVRLQIAISTVPLLSQRSVSPERHSTEPEAIVNLVAGSPSQAIKAIANALETGSLSLRSSSVGVSALRGVDAQTARRCSDAFAQLKPALDES